MLFCGDDAVGASPSLLDKVASEELILLLQSELSEDDLLNSESDELELLVSFDATDEAVTLADDVVLEDALKLVVEAELEPCDATSLDVELACVVVADELPLD